MCASASRPESNEWVRKLGALEVVNHRTALNAEVKNLGKQSVDYVFCLNSTDTHWDAMVDIIAPQGRICSIVETSEPHDLAPLMNKSAGFVWELMFTRTLHSTPDVSRQGQILKRLAELLDAGELAPTLTKTLSPICPQTIDQAHQMLVAGHTIGKIALEGWD